MRWKKLFIAVALVLVVLIAGLFAFIELYNFNKFKPLISRIVKNATGREINIGGDIDIDFGIPPTIKVENVTFQNAAWSKQPDLGRVNRLEAQMAVWPLFSGKFDFAHLVLVEPDVIVEFDSAGTSNFSFDAGGEKKDESKIPPPPLIFSDIQIEKGLFTYKDARSGLIFTVRIDQLTAKIPGFDESLQLEFKGAFDDKPFALSGILGPIWAWVEPGYSLPVDLTATASGTTAKIMGKLRDPINFKDLAFDITAQGSSVAKIAKLAGLADAPELGAFKLTAKVDDSAGNLAIEKLDIQIGSQELVAISLGGELRDVFALQGVNLNLTVQGQDSAKLTQLGLPALPERGAFQVTAQISDPAANEFTVSDLSVVLGENEVDGQINLNLAEKDPFLTAQLASQKFRFGQFNLDLKMSGPLEKPAIEKIDLKVGTSELAEIRLNGVVEDLRELQGVDIDFQASSKNLANLKQVTGQPFPVRGVFSAAGKVLIPVHKNLKIPDLKITAGKNNISGSLNLDLSKDQPQLQANLSLPKLDLPSVLRPELAKQGWAKGLNLVRPIKLTTTLAGFSQEIALKKVDLQAGTLNSAELRLTGSVANLLEQRGIDLNFNLRGKDAAKLKEITAQPYIFAPVSGQGSYTISGHVSDPTDQVYKVKNFKFAIVDTQLTGQLDFNLAGQFPVYEVNLAGPKFNLKWFPLPKEAAYANLNKIDDLGPLKIHSKVVVDGSRLSMPTLDIRAGHDDLVSMVIKGSVKHLTEKMGIDLNFKIQGDDVANLKKITGQTIPLAGIYSLSGKLTDLAAKKYKFDDLNLKMGKNDITGSIDLNLSGNKLQLEADLAAPKFTLRPLTFPTVGELSQIEDIGPLKLKLVLANAGKKLALNNLDFNLGRDDLIQVLLKGSINDLSAVRGMKLEFSATGNDMSNFKKLGGPEIPYQGSFSISGEFIDPAVKVYKIPSFKASVGENHQRGWLELDLTAKHPRLKGELLSEKLDLRPIFQADEKKSDSEAKSVKPTIENEKNPKHKSINPDAQKDRVFSAKPIRLEALQLLDVDLQIRNKQVLLPTLALDDVIVDILLKGGNLEIKPFKFTTGGGKAEVEFALRSQNKPATLTTNLNIDQLDLGLMLDKLGYKRSVEGNLDATSDLNGSGDSVAALMAGLNGNIRMAMSNGRVASEYLELLEKYLGSGILRMINPFEERREFTPVNCFVNKVEIKDGLADVKILLDTDRTSIFGAGDVNLKTERLDLGVKPTPKKGAMPANISFSFRELSQPFRLGGTLAQPSLAIDPGRTALIVGKMAGALALGPIGIAAFFADVSVGKKDPCAVALGEENIKDQTSDANKEEVSKQTTAENEKKKKEKSGGFFKRLFGK